MRGWRCLALLHVLAHAPFVSSSLPSTPPASSLAAAKADLLARLAENGNSTKSPDVLRAVGRVACYNTAFSCDTPEACGLWTILTAIDRPGSLGVDERGRNLYTLGALSFNLFEPKDLVCAVVRVENEISDCAAGGEDHSRYYANTIVFDVMDGIRGELVNIGVCRPALVEGRMLVTITGGVLRPSPGTDMDKWRRVFGRAKVGPVRWLARQVRRAVVGLRPPRRMGEDGSISFEIRRPPRGYVDIVYLDEDLRITRGDRGRIVVTSKEKDRAD